MTESFSEHRLSCAGRTIHRDIVSARGGNFQSHLRHFLSFYFRKIYFAFFLFSLNPGGMFWLKFNFNFRLLIFFVVCLFFVEVSDDFLNIFYSKNFYAANERRFAGIFFRQIYLFKPASFGFFRNRQDPAYLADFSVQRQLAKEYFSGGIEFYFL